MFECFAFSKDIGRICGGVPFTVTFAGKWPFLAVAVGDCFHIYSAEELKLVYISDPHPGPIARIAASPGLVATATASLLRITDTGKRAFLDSPLSAPLSYLLSLDSFFVSACGTAFAGHAFSDFAPLFTVDCEKEITALLHPLSYKNKFLVAFADTTFELWNAATQARIFAFRGFGSIVRQFVQSPKPDIFAIVCCDGRVVFHDARLDATHFSLQHPSPVTGVAFRQDGPGHFVVGLESGALFTWDLKNRQILSSLPDCHESAVSSVCAIKGTAFVITGGADNCIRQWLFDENTEGVLRLNRFRVGHSEPPRAVTFAEVNGVVQLVTASGNCRIIAVNPAAETTAVLLSTSPLYKRNFEHPIQALSATNAHRFVSVASQHEGGTLVFLWDLENSRFAKHAMSAMPHSGPKLAKSEKIPFAEFHGERKATCACLTRCGNFGCVGTDAGTVEVFVTQSGRHKGGTETRHDAPVAFVHVDSLNTAVVSGSIDGTVFFHDFQRLTPLGMVQLPIAPVGRAAAHPNSQLLAIACGETVQIFDCQSRQIARVFTVEANHLCFSHDGRYLFVASSAPFVHLFDLVSSTLIETVELAQPLAGIAAHPGGGLIATIHEGLIGTKLWHFRPEKIKTIAGLSAGEENEIEGLAVFSEQPPQKLKNLLNPPKDPLRFVKAKRLIPFFLTASTNIAALAAQDRQEAGLAALTGDVVPSTEFVSCLVADHEAGDFTPSIAMLLGMGHDQVALEIAGLRASEKRDERLIFMALLEFALRSRREFEMVQGLIHVFLTAFGAKILQNRAMKARLVQLRDLQKEAICFMEQDLSHAIYLLEMVNRIQ
jgi:U3 small nucleolar RNA-associated protein 21